MSRYKDFIKLLEFSNGKYNAVDIFKDFVVMSAIAIKNKIYYEQKDEDVYLKLINKYSKNEVDIFPQLASELIKIFLNCHEIEDVLGEVFEQIGASSKLNSQFFTPNHIAGFMSACIIDKEEIKQKEFVTVNDPTCGSGVMLLAFARKLKEADIDYSNKIFVEAQDIDFVCCCMTYIQLSVYGIPGRVMWGDTLLLQSNRIFYTPQFVSGQWNKKLKEEFVHDNSA